MHCRTLIWNNDRYSCLFRISFFHQYPISDINRANPSTITVRKRITITVRETFYHFYANYLKWNDKIKYFLANVSTNGETLNTDAVYLHVIHKKKTGFFFFKFITKYKCKYFKILFYWSESNVINLNTILKKK